MTDQDPAARTCAWCSATAPGDATQCPGCGAALAQRESLAGVVIPGVTGLDPALADADGRPMRIPGPSPSQGMANGVMVAAAIGGPVGLVALGGMAAVVASEYVGARRDHGSTPALDALGRPSEVALRALERLDAEEHGRPAGEAPAADPWRDEPRAGEPQRGDEPWGGRSQGGDPASASLPAAAADPWRDLPSTADQDAPPAPDPWRDLPAPVDATSEPDRP
jgi:hypothetical protein